MSSETDLSARGNWPGKLTRLEAQDDGEYVYLHATSEQRVSMMWELSRAAFALTGQPLPTYDRREAPGHMVRSGGR